MNKRIEQQALTLINRTDCAAFPIDVYEIAQNRRYNVRHYGNSKNLIQKLNLTEYSYNYPGFSIKCDNKYYIFVEDNLVPDAERKVIAHEIGHIVLHHLDSRGVFGHSDDAELSCKYESEADSFAIYLLAPVPMLAIHKIQTPEDIKKLTTLSLADSNQAFANLTNYREDCSILDDRKRLRERYKKQQGPFRLFKSLSTSKIYILLILMLIISVCLIWSFNNDEGDTLSVVSSPNAESEYSSALNAESVYYWTEGGYVFHTHEDCQSLKNSLEILSGTLKEAQQEKDRLCKFCEKRDK